MGKPTAAASAMVPGPAFVTKMSAATIYSAIFVVNPLWYINEGRRTDELPCATTSV